jgi:hypothetical protein
MLASRRPLALRLAALTTAPPTDLCWLAMNAVLRRRRDMEATNMSDPTAEPVGYMERTRRYYRALGYDNDYVWAHFENAPFTAMTKPLHEARIGLVTTAGPADLSNRDAKRRKHVWSGDTAAAPPAFDTDLAWDREATHVADRETYLPIDAVRALVSAGVVGGLAQRFHGAPTDYSHSKTLEHDAPELLARLREDGADAALLTAL